MNIRNCLWALSVAVILAACGGGDESVSSTPVPVPVPVLKAATPTPVRQASTITGGNAVVIHLYQALYGMAPSNALLLDYASQANNDASLFAKNLTDRFATTSNADLAKLVLDNFEVTTASVPAINSKGESEYSLLLDAVKQLFGAYPTMRGQVILNMTNLLVELESDATYGAAAVAYNSQAAASFTYSSNPANNSSASVKLPPAPTVTLTISSSSILQGDSVTLSWSSTNATSCMASGGWSGSLAAVGSQSVQIGSIGTTAFNITCVSGSLTANASSNVATTEKPYFVEVPNALIVQMPVGTTAAFNAFAIDINHDGHDDLVIHFWGSFWGQDVGNTPSPNALRIYIYQADGTFKDQTDNFLHNGFDLGGASYPVKIGDINSDGKPDLIFGITRDDGRLLANVLDNSQMAALVSVGNEYVLRKFGKAGGYHSVGIGYDTENRPYVIGNYFGNDSYYFDSAGNPIPTGLSLPSPGFSTFEFYNPKGELLSSSYLLQSSNSGLNYMSVDGFIKNLDQSWSQISSYPLLPRVGSVQGICYTGDVCGTNPVFFINGKYLTFSGIGKSCKIKLNPTSDEIIIFTVAGHVIPNFIDGAAVTQNGLPEQYTAMKAVTITNNAIVEVPLNIYNEQMVNINYNYFDCKDMNGDGYSDIVVYPYNSDGIPLVYLNNREKTFSFIGKANFPQISDSWGNAASSILHDFDRDGIADLIIFRTDGSASLGPINYHFYKGSKTLR